MRYRRPKDYEIKLEDLKRKGILCDELQQSDYQNKELLVEIGMGRGDFLTRYALEFPQKSFLGIEKQSALLILAGKKIQDNQLTNIRLMSFDAQQLCDYMEEDCIGGIFLNFSDPWLKQRYSKRRLTHINMLQKYASLSRKNAFLKVKTDNRGFFDFTVEQVRKSRYRIVEQIEDLYAPHNMARFDSNDPIWIQTEYEKKFISLQKAIFSLECELV